MQLEKMINDVAPLVSLPAVCARLNEMVDDPSCSADDIGRVINQDAALTARLLRIANSPMYGFTTQIDTVTRAVTVLGTKQVRDIALATAAVKSFQGIPNTLVSMQKFWEHSICCALCARTLAMDCLRHQREAVFVAGLLHDIGGLVMYNREPDLSRQALESCTGGPEGLEIQNAERELFGFDHADVGGALAHRWSLPINLQECIAYHHNPGWAKEHRVEAAIVHIANSIAILAGLDTTDVYHAPKIQPIAWELVGLDEEVIPATLASAQAQISSTRALLMGS
jgi:putative nucleotidyltransferase with HDIG domain